MEDMRNSSVISHWQSCFYGVNYATINETVSYLHKHANYKQLKESLLLNFDKYDSKEISFICKTFNAINLRNETDEINLKLNQYCLNNINKFDLHDFYNITFNKSNLLDQFYQDSQDFAVEKIQEDNIKQIKLDIDKNDDIFENKMETLDIDSKLWFKLNILRCFSGQWDATKAKSISDYLLNEGQFLTTRDQNEYEINTVIGLKNRIRFLNKIIKENPLKSKLFEPFLNEGYLDKVFNGLGLCYYKKDYFGYFDVISSCLNVNQLDFLLNYFEVKTKTAKTDYLLFLYSKALNWVLIQKSMNREYRLKINYKNVNDNRIYLSKDSNPLYYHLVDNLNKDFKRIFEKQYNLYINDLDGFNFEFVASSLRLIYNIHSNKQEVLNLFYKAFFNFYSNIKPIDFLHFQKLILSLLDTLIELKDESNELNRSNEIKLCSMLDFDIYYNKDFAFRSKQNFLSFLML